MERDRIGKDVKPDVTGTDNDIIRAAMMEELGTERLNTLPLSDRIKVALAPSNLPLAMPTLPATGNPWQAFVADDIDPSTTEGLDSMHGGMLYRMRRGFSSTPAARGGLTGGTFGRGGTASQVSTAYGRATQDHTPAHFYRGGSGTRMTAHIETTIDRLRESPENVSPKKLQNSRPIIAKPINARIGHHRGANPGSVRGAHQQGPLARSAPVKYDINTSADAFLAHMSYAPARATSAPISTNASTPVNPRPLGLAGSKWATQTEAPTVAPDTHISENSLPPEVGLAGSRCAPQAETPAAAHIASAIVEAAPCPGSPSPDRPLAPASLAKARIQIPIPAGQIFEQPPATPAPAVNAPSIPVATRPAAIRKVKEQKSVKVLTEDGNVVMGAIALYESDDPAIIIILEIVADGSEKVNDPISDQDYFKVVGDVLTYRSKTEGSPRWRVRFQLPFQAAAFEKVFLARIENPHRSKEHYSRDASTTHDPSPSKTLAAPLSLTNRTTSHQRLFSIISVEGTNVEPPTGNVVDELGKGSLLIDFDAEERVDEGWPSANIADLQVLMPAQIDAFPVEELLLELNRDPSWPFLEQVLENVESDSREQESPLLTAAKSVLEHRMRSSENFQALSEDSKPLYIDRIGQKVLDLALSAYDDLGFANPKDSIKNETSSELVPPQTAEADNTVPEVTFSSKGTNSNSDVDDAQPPRIHRVYTLDVLYDLRNSSSAAIEKELKSKPVYNLIGMTPRGDAAAARSKASTAKATNVVQAPSRFYTAQAENNDAFEEAIWTAVKGRDVLESLGLQDSSSDTNIPDHSSNASSRIEKPEKPVAFAQPKRKILHCTGLSQSLENFHLSENPSDGAGVTIQTQMTSSPMEKVSADGVFPRTACHSNTAAVSATSGNKSCGTKPPSIEEVLKAAPGLSASMWATDSSPPPTNRARHRPAAATQQTNAVLQHSRAPSVHSPASAHSPLSSVSTVAPVYQTVIYTDPVTGREMEVTGMVKLGPVPIVTHGPVPVSFVPQRQENTPLSTGSVGQSLTTFPTGQEMHKRNASNASNASSDYFDFKTSIRSYITRPERGRGHGRGIRTAIPAIRQPLSPVRGPKNIRGSIENRLNQSPLGQDPHFSEDQ